MRPYLRHRTPAGHRRGYGHQRDICYPGPLMAAWGIDARGRHISSWVSLAPLEKCGQGRVRRGYVKYRVFNGGAPGGGRSHPVSGIPPVPEHRPADGPHQLGSTPGLSLGRYGKYGGTGRGLGGDVPSRILRAAIAVGIGRTVCLAGNRRAFGGCGQP